MTVGYGDYRAARAALDWRGAWIVAHQIAHDDERGVALADWWRCADLDHVAGQVLWWGRQYKDGPAVKFRSLIAWNRTNTWMEFGSLRVNIPPAAKVLSLDALGMPQRLAHIHPLMPGEIPVSDEEWCRRWNALVLNAIKAAT